jgi:uncharacterized protein (TIGR04255 family)
MRIDMNKIPLSISPDPIAEAIFELRFDASIPDDAVFGVLYGSFKDEYPEVEQLPVLQLPSVIRNQENLQYVPHYKLTSGNFVAQIGPKVFVMSCVGSYGGWGVFSEKIYNAYDKLLRLNFIKCETRRSLRYVNIFPDINICKKTALRILLGDKTIGEQLLTLTAEVPHDFGASKLVIANNAVIKKPEGVINGSVIDVDTFVKPELLADFGSSIEYAHNEEKKVFFECLDSEFLASMNPKYS